MLDRPHNSSFEKPAEKVPEFFLGVPDGEDVVRVRWGNLSFALIPQFIKGVSGRDNVFIDLQRMKTHPEEGIEAEILDEITFGLEVPLQTADGTDNQIFDDKFSPVVKASLGYMRRFVDPTITDADFGDLIAAAKSAYLKTMKARQNGNGRIH